MKNAVTIGCCGRNQRAGDLLVNRLLPDDQIKKVGPFVFLDHVYPFSPRDGEGGRYRGQNAHPHRGIATLSYLLSGSLKYLDSRDHEGTIDSGGALWLKAGNGILHDEQPDARGGVLHALQFWINLPAVNKNEDPESRALPAADIPELELPDHAGALRLVLGSCGSFRSPLETFLSEFIYHIRLNPKSVFSYTTRQDTEYAVFVPADDIRVNEQLTGNSHLVVFSKAEGVIRLHNPGITIADAFIFGGCEYTEPIVAAGPFIMNSRDEISEAYEDFFAGRYGKLANPQPF